MGFGAELVVLPKTIRHAQESLRFMSPCQVDGATRRDGFPAGIARRLGICMSSVAVR